jgi:hypothetical protein
MLCSLKRNEFQSQTNNFYNIKTGEKNEYSRNKHTNGVGTKKQSSATRLFVA